MFIMGVSSYSMLVFSLLTMLVAVPSAIKIFNWTFTLYKGSITFETPMLYAFGFMGSVYHWRTDGSLSRHIGNGHSPDGDLLHRGALSLCDGGRHVDGVPGGDSFLVAEDYRPHVSGEDLAVSGGSYIYRIQFYVFSAIHSGHAGNAAGAMRRILRSSRF